MANGSLKRKQRLGCGGVKIVAQELLRVPNYFDMQQSQALQNVFRKSTKDVLPKLIKNNELHGLNTLEATSGLSVKFNTNFNIVK